MRVSAEFFVGDNAPPRASRAWGFFMENIITETFDNWTDYNKWLVGHYEEYAVTSLKEIDGKIVAGLMSKEDWDKERRAAGSI